MGVMPTIGPRRQLPPQASVAKETGEYVIEFDVSDFELSELRVEVVGSCVVVQGDQLEDEEAGQPFCVHERVEESVRLPDDVDPDRITAVYGNGTLELHARRRNVARRRVPITRNHLVNPTPKGC
jgi:HSP20 family molecular chaperone IbpA